MSHDARTLSTSQFDTWSWLCNDVARWLLSHSPASFCSLANALNNYGSAWYHVLADVEGSGGNRHAAVAKRLCLGC
jgi:hypothetical protein